MCVETLKRDWKATTTLRDVLVTISCLLVYPNASSALNAEAGMLLEQQGGAGWEGFERRAKLMTRLQAGVPRELRALVGEAQKRGEDAEESGDKDEAEVERKDSGLEDQDGDDVHKVRRRRRRDFAPVRGKLDFQDRSLAERKTRTPSPDAPASPPGRLPPPRSFVVESSRDDVFGNIRLPHPSLQAPQLHQDEDEDSELQETNQENDTSADAKRPSLYPNPVRHGPPVPLGELTLADDRDTSFDDSMEAEYPPSPKKSPMKQKRASDDYYHEPGPPSPRKESPRKMIIEHPASPKKTANPAPRRGLFNQDSAIGSNIFAPSRPDFLRAESSRTAAVRGEAAAGRLFFTPDNQMNPGLLSSQTPDPRETDESEFEMSFEILRQSERKKRHLLSSPPKRKTRTRNVTPERNPFGGSVMKFGASGAVVGASSAAVASAGVRKSPRAVKSNKSDEQKKREKTEAKLWKLCGGDVERWNRGDFGGFLNIKSSRW